MLAGGGTGGHVYPALALASELEARGHARDEIRFVGGTRGPEGRIVSDIRAQYQLGFHSTNPATDGAWRRVEIRALRKGVRLRSRKGYFAPYKD